MSKKKKRRTPESCIRQWKCWLINDCQYSTEKSDSLIKKLLLLLEHMQLGYAVFSYRRKTGEDMLVRGSLMYYQRDFHRRFKWKNLNHTIPYWDKELENWRVFDLANLQGWLPEY